jgi:hypothetical protein
MKIIEVNLGQTANFWRDEHFNSFRKNFAGTTIVGEIIAAYAKKYPEKAKLLLEAPMPVFGKPQVEKEQTPVEKVLERMYNWKQDSALRYAKEINDFPKQALKKLEHLSEKFGNCGWQDGKIYNELRNTNFEVAKMLGYEYNEKKDCFLPIKV